MSSEPSNKGRAARIFTMLTVAVTLIVGVAILLTPLQNCAPPSPLVVAPGENAAKELAYCVYQRPYQFNRGPVAGQPGLPTGECRPTRVAAEAVRADMRETREAQYQLCRLARTVPPQATVDYVRSLVTTR